MAIYRSMNTDFREQHWTAILGGIDQHLNRKPPFRRVAL
jgi:hypothetical protein